MIGEIIGSIAIAVAFFFICIVLPFWLLGAWLNRNDPFIPDNRPTNLNEED